MTETASCTPNLVGLTPYDEALDLLLQNAHPVEEVEEVELKDALGRVLAEPVISLIDVPAWDNSAMDGYAVRAADVAHEGSRLSVSQRIPAGIEPLPLQPGTAARIFTGAPVPQGADSVIMQELCAADGEGVTFNTVATAGSNIRLAGEDIEHGSTIVPAGVRLQPQHLGLAASVGVARLTVRRRLKVAVIASGDELLMPGEALQPGKIFNSNLFSAIGLLQSLGCEVVNPGVVEDTFDATMKALTDAANAADLVLASGGVSVGEEDHVKPAVEALGELHMWKLAIRPGKPLAFGHIGSTPFIGTPGNPVALFITFILLARPFILRSMGVEACKPKSIEAVAGFEWSKPDKRREFHRARLSRAEDGSNLLVAYPSRSSAVLSSVVWADGLVVIPEGRKIMPGDKVEFLSFSELVA